MAKKTKKAPIKLIPLCRHSGCEQQAYSVPVFAGSPRVHKEPSRRIYKEEDGTFTQGGELTSTVSYSSKVHPTGLCYYHLKQHLEYFEAEYPLKAPLAPMFDCRTKEPLC